MADRGDIYGASRHGELRSARRWWRDSGRGERIVPARPPGSPAREPARQAPRPGGKPLTLALSLPHPADELQPCYTTTSELTRRGGGLAGPGGDGTVAPDLYREAFGVSATACIAIAFACRPPLCRRVDRRHNALRSGSSDVSHEHRGQPSRPRRVLPLRTFLDPQAPNAQTKRRATSRERFRPDRLRR